MCAKVTRLWSSWRRSCAAADSRAKSACPASALRCATSMPVVTQGCKRWSGQALLQSPSSDAKNLTRHAHSPRRSPGTAQGLELFRHRHEGERTANQSQKSPGIVRHRCQHIAQGFNFYHTGGAEVVKQGGIAFEVIQSYHRRLRQECGQRSTRARGQSLGCGRDGSDSAEKTSDQTIP